MSDSINREQALKTIYSRYRSAYEWYLKNGISGKEIDFALTSYAECHVAIRNIPSAEPLTEEDYTELRDRFGEYVEFVVRDMVEGKGERWTKSSLKKDEKY